MYFIYVDESIDGPLMVISALAVPCEQWRASLLQIQSLRRDWNARYGMYVRKELHAREFVSGRGKVGPTMIPKARRCLLFDDMLTTIAAMPGVRLLNATCTPKTIDWAFERLLNRVQRMVSDPSVSSHAAFVCDQGKEALYPPLARRVRAFNPIPSKFGGWHGTGASTKSILADRIIEDPFFVESGNSLFIQAVDCCAYALLRKERPIPSKSKYGLHLSFDKLDPILVKAANRSDPQGIIRV